MFSIPVIIAFIIGMLLVLFALDLILAPTTFKCDRLKNTCYRESHHIWSKNMKRETLCALSDIQQARVTTSASGSETTMYHVVLEMKNGDSMSIFHSSSSVKLEHEKNAEMINNFLQHGHKELCIKDTNVLGGIILMCFGFMIMGTGKAIEELFLFLNSINQ